MGNTCSIKEPKNIKSPSHINIYLRIVPRIAFYLKNKNISAIFKYKCPLFAAAGGVNGRIYLFSNSLEHMSTLRGHKGSIHSLCGISHKILASGSEDKNIKIWDIEKRVIISTLSGHTKVVTTLCYVGDGQLVSGSWDESLIIWSKLPGSSSTYSQRQVLTGHKSCIKGIIRISKAEIMSGEHKGDLRIWNIDEGVCIRHISHMRSDYLTLRDDYLTQMKQHHEGEVALNYNEKVRVFGALNNWKAPIKQFRVSAGSSIEFLDRDILLRGKYDGQLEFIDYTQTGCSMQPTLQGLHSNVFYDIQRITKNILVTASDDASLKVIDPIIKKCYLKFKKGINMEAIVYFY